MRYLILCAALMGVVTAYIGPLNTGSYASLHRDPPVDTTETIAQEEITPTNVNDESSSASSSSSTSSTTPEAIKEPIQEQQPISELPVSMPALLQELEAPKRRVITYDQRQEGQYNIRADLDNFMFLLIPTVPADNFNILDILTKSSLRRSPHSSPKSKKKHYLSAGSQKQDGHSKYRQSLKHSDYLQRENEHYGGVASSRAGEFLEGRTPYHVDISALNDEESPVRQVDVLPPPYPLAYQHLMKPFLDADSSIIQTLPPADMSSRQLSETSHNPGFYRFARYIRGDNFLDTNRVTTSNRLGSPQGQASVRRITQVPLYRADLSLGAAQLYPPLDVPHYSFQSTARNFDDKPSTSSEDIESKQTLDGADISYEDVFIPSVHIRPLEDDLELDLHTDSLIDGEAKALLSDGIERCAPGKRRDSYGVCREIEGY